MRQSEVDGTCHVSFEAAQRQERESAAEIANIGGTSWWQLWHALFKAVVETPAQTGAA